MLVTCVINIGHENFSFLLITLCRLLGSEESSCESENLSHSCLLFNLS